jgi:hypothetical protein
MPRQHTEHSTKIAQDKGHTSASKMVIYEETIKDKSYLISKDGSGCYLSIKSRFSLIRSPEVQVLSGRDFCPTSRDQVARGLYHPCPLFRID